jgi:hypothetical protein
MKKVILLAMFMPVMAYGQIIETFETGTAVNWKQGADGHWKADTTASISGEFSLHHVFDSPSTGSDCIGIPLKDLHPDEGLTRWRFLIRHGYDPSSTNNWAAYLMSDADPASFAGGAALNGFAIGVNLTGYDDSLRLWKIREGSASTLITCPLNWQNDIGIKKACSICVERTDSGLWTISVYNPDDKLICTVRNSDDEIFNASWFVLNYRYSSTRDRLLWLDDVEIDGVFYEDIEPPEIIECRITGIKSLEIVFSEEPSDDTMLPSNFQPDDTGNFIISINRKTETIYELAFSTEFKNKILNRLTISHLCDRIGNCKDNAEISFIPVRAEAGDVVISEIMADPLPAVNLPGKEYLEIFNRSTFSFDLKNWNFMSGDVDASFPGIILEPGGYLILCSVADTTVFRDYGKSVGLKPFPALSDNGKMVVIADSMGNLIHGLEYSSDWYGNKLKEEGGWSLEIINTDFPFYTKGNWEASSSLKGGTPGSMNSVSRYNQDMSFSGIQNAFPEDSITLNIQLSETITDMEQKRESITIGNDPVSSVLSIDPLYRRFRIRTDKPLVSGQVYELHLSGDVTDFAGNSIIRNSFRFGIPAQAQKGDIVFNELLFNPLPDDPDYIELYNCSDRIIDASRLCLASINESGDTSEINFVSEEQRCFIPGTWYVVTTDRSRIIERYFTSGEENIFELSSLPSMPDDRGHLLLMTRELELIDEVIYSDEMHFPLLDGTEGISLEKIRPHAASDNSMNWHSASENSGWGTPGAENSVFSKVPQADDQIIFSSGKITPDNDGYEDVLVIDLDPAGLGNVVTVTVFDEGGSYIRRIAENLFAGTRASVIWDGTSNDGTLVRTGIYVILIELFNDKGKTKSWKKVCTVIR